MKRIAVFTSGGDAPGMNAAIRAVVRTGIHHGLQVFGIKRGYEGMIDGDIIKMDSHSVSNILQRGGTILYSARSKRFRTKKGRAIAYKNLKKHKIDGVVAIGGDGTFTGANIFTKEYPDITFVGLPGTIDNDLLGTDFTIGYDTALNTAMEAIDKIKDTANAHNRLFFVEVMGRDAGFIALRSAIACGAEAVLIPETKTNVSKLIRTLKKNYKEKKTSSIVIVAEGDDGGNAMEVSEKVKKQFNKFDIRVTVLGHLQRGGSPTSMERVLASRLGMEGVKALLEGQKQVMVGQIHRDIVYTPFSESIKHNTKLNPLLLELVEVLS